MKQLIPFALSFLTIFAMWLIGNKDWRGWVVGLGNQVLWLAFIVTFRAWGLLILLVCLVGVYTRNLLLWRAPT